MAINGIRTHLSGLGGSGLDTDQLVSSLMNVERLPLTKLSQKKQLAEWKRDEYKSITNLLRSIKDEYFNVLKPSNNMLSQSSYKKYTPTSSNDKIVTISGNAEAVAGSHTITVTSIATADKAVSTGSVTDVLQGTAVINDADVAGMKGKIFNVTLDGVTKEIKIGDYTTVDTLAAGLQSQISQAFGAGKVTVGNSNPGGAGALIFNTAGGASKITLTSGSSNDALAGLKFNSGASNRLNTGDSLEALATKFSNNLTFNASGKLIFTINSKTFTFDKSTALSSMMSTINSDATANVNIKYDEATDKFNIISKQTGDGDNITLSQTGGNFFTQGATPGAANIDIANPVAPADQGSDAIVTIDGQSITRNSNNFTLNGVTYTLLKAHDNPATEEETVSLTADVNGVYDNIKKFVDKYNEAIDTINGKLSEKYERSYQPLTSEQREVMSEDDIKKWEERAKTGLLRNDSMLQGIVQDMRKALYEAVDGKTLSSIGITTGSYQEKGRLIIDETKLKKAITDSPDSVMNLFSKKSTSTSSNVNLTSTQRKQRFEEEGLANRLSDIIEDNIRTNRDNSGRKGLLLEKAGIEGDASEFSNLLYKEISDYDEKLYELNYRLIDKENKYYEKFAALESALSKMNSQSSWLSSQLGGSQ
ncbi:MAG: flagellar capping protein [Clostridiales bacterium]|nr:flagellar capping protein [Clostridiales bacterium]